MGPKDSQRDCGYPGVLVGTMSDLLFCVSGTAGERIERQRGIGDQVRLEKPARMRMSSAAILHGDRRDIGAVIAGTKTVVAPSIAIMPDDAKGMVRREPLADLTRQDRTLHNRYDRPLKREASPQMPRSCPTSSVS